MADVLVPAEVFPPGEYLRDEIEARGWTEKEFAEILGRPAQVVSEIFNGKKQIIPETALALSEALGTSAELWINLQTAYSLFAARSERPKVTDVSRRARLRERVPVAELRSRGWIPHTNDLEVVEAAVKDLLGIADLNEDPSFLAAARRTDYSESFSPQQVAWLAQLRRLAKARNVASFDPKAISRLADDLIHRIHDPTDLGELEGWFAECGIVLITLLPLKGSKLDGAVMFLDDRRPIIGLTSRGDRMDSYVFTLLHELAHLKLGHLDVVGVRADEDLIECADAVGIEAEANRQAAEWIMPLDAELPNGRPSLPVVLQIAGRFRVHPSFVIGRIQRRNRDWGLLRRSIPRVRPYVQLVS